MIFSHSDSIFILILSAVWEVVQRTVKMKRGRFDLLRERWWGRDIQKIAKIPKKKEDEKKKEGEEEEKKDEKKDEKNEEKKEEEKKPVEEKKEEQNKSAEKEEKRGSAKERRGSAEEYRQKKVGQLSRLTLSLSLLPPCNTSLSLGALRQFPHSSL